MINNILQYLQSRSPQTKNKILFFTLSLVALALGSIWISSLKTHFGGLTKEDILPEAGTVLSAENYVTVEAADEKNDKRYIYFKVENHTTDILNFPNTEQISLKVAGQEIHPEKILTRQDQSFVVKILSNTTNHGVMIFPEIEKSEGELKIDRMFFEQNPTNIFRQTIEVDFDKLDSIEELRS
ncbi:MAG: hypothetical protein KW793_00310 [Candidatus Doudnabacteria bacterium]|nr:hypothetical protein [Candidatus Doudnabacteria bacterium]